MANTSVAVALWKFENVTVREACRATDAIASADRGDDDWKNGAATSTEAKPIIKAAAVSLYIFINGRLSSNTNDGGL
jgi:hypothetical protein